MNTLTILFLILWGVVLLRAFHRGFIRTILSFVLFLLFIGAVFALRTPVTSTLSESTAVNRWAVKTSREFLISRIEEVRSGKTSDSLWMAILPIPEEAAELFDGSLGPYAADILETDAVLEPLAEKMAVPLIGIAGIAATLILCLIIILLIKGAFSLIGGHREYRGTDHILGLIPGFVKAALYSWAILAVLRVVTGLGGGGPIAAMIAESPFLSVLDGTNPFVPKSF